MLLATEKKVHGKKETPPLFPNKLPSTVFGFFTGLDVEIFDRDLIEEVCKSGYGLNPKPRQMTMNQDTDETAKKTGSLVLFPEEAFFLHQYFNLQVSDLDDRPMPTKVLWSEFCNLKEKFVEFYVAYLYLKSKCWVVKPGMKFGTDYLIYKLGPQFNHSSFAVNITSNNRRYSVLSYHTNERIVETTKKILLHLEVQYPENICPSSYLDNLKLFQVKEVMFQRLDLIKQMS